MILTLHISVMQMSSVLQSKINKRNKMKQAKNTHQVLRKRERERKIERDREKQKEIVR